MLLQRKLDILMGMVYHFGGSPKASPAPIVEPPVENAEFEAGEDDESDKNKKKTGKSSLTVDRVAKTTPSTAKGASKPAGLSVGK